ncbi:pyridoxamine 5'-phosphate oxidase [Orenia metallireducens]|jgi:nitroimidazol reductase NimA-like FMN-containing flavoprotein (pyridoxamine 5'-phosphate oxidase superfamily)|uniref:Pyridoxamine 5'-phosphate oxidase n=1 Tax=Orenia metallireducens TaxID=1413210 RepID=A0A285GQW3_9FIRM|nr:pyridoxamine 5'-phosphate oxidase family protein [Orenia metallireducens]PRX29790.1 pyridoxamine 5'-phosphate oxidase [Orenia metallireducens]SNY24876.1 Pyridoxamine 5'-phosphate oxidase [Orenia metallireducens]
MATATITGNELKETIINFLKKKDTGALATSGIETRVSPVKYFLGEGLDIYIHSNGGSKFKNLEKNKEVCLLVSTEFYGDYETIKGVQIFGQAEIGQEGSNLHHEAEQYCPFEHMGDEGGYIIKINAKKAIYKDAVDGSGEKSIWKA